MNKQNTTSKRKVRRSPKPKSMAAPHPKKVAHPHTTHTEEKAVKEDKVEEHVKARKGLLGRIISFFKGR